MDSFSTTTYWLRAKLNLIILLVAFQQFGHAQAWLEKPDSLVTWRVATNVGGQSVLYVSTLAALQVAWYSEYQSAGFRFFNDWSGWAQMDKFGHSNSTYQVARNLYAFNRWSGMKENPSIWWASGTAFSYQLVVEIMDGFSDGWGFSNGDMLFNTIGVGTFIGQQMLWEEQRLKLKFSFWPSGLDEPNDFGTNYREVARAEALFGTGLHEQWLKDYNGQTYWLSANIWSLTGKPSFMPKWLNLALGYSANNMYGAESNTWLLPDGESYTNTLVRERQILLSLDLDLEHVNLPPALVWVKPIIGVIKFPFPALEWNNDRGILFHGIYL